MADTIQIKLPLIAPEQALKYVTHNEALEVLDVAVQLSVVQIGLVTPPGSPAIGNTYGIGSAATDGWSGKDGQLARWSSGGWRFITPRVGWVLWDANTSALYVHSGSDWLPLASFLDALQNQSLLGVNTTADATNKFSVRSNAALFNGLDVASGGTGDIRLTLNKETATDTAAVIFQSGFSGRAEFGLSGNEDFTVRVSPNGSSFSTALTIDRTDAFVRMEHMFGSAPSYPTIAGGILTAATSYVIPAPETGVTDTVDTISGGFDGAILVITGTAGNTLTFGDGTGNLKLGGARVLDNFEDSLMLVKRGSDWIEIAFASNG